MSVIKFRALFWAVIFLGCWAIGIAVIKKMGYSINYQASCSMPKGFYFVMPVRNISRKEVVIFTPPQYAKNFLLRYHLAPRNGWLMKKVYGLPGDKVCTKNNFLWINDKKIAYIDDFYKPGKKVPKQNFCQILGEQEYLLLSLDDSRSYDGRYFGPVAKKQIYGQAKLLFSLN